MTVKQGGLAHDARDTVNADNADDAGVLVAVKQGGLAADAHDADDARVLVAVKSGGLVADDADDACLWSRPGGGEARGPRS